MRNKTETLHYGYDVALGMEPGKLDWVKHQLIEKIATDLSNKIDWSVHTNPICDTARIETIFRITY